MSLPPVLPPRGQAGTGTSSTAQASQSSNQAAAGAAQSSSDVKPLEGKTSIDDKLTIECDILCYSSVNKIAAQVAEEFGKMHSSPAVVILLDDTSKSALQLYLAFSLQADLLKQEFARAEKEATPQVPEMAEGEVIKESFAPLIGGTAIKAAVTGATNLGRSVIDLLALFRTDTTYSGRTVTINEDSLALSLAGKLAEKGHMVVYPKLLLFPPSRTEAQTEKDFQHSLQSIVNARDDTNHAVRVLATKVAVASQQLSELQKTHPHGHKRRVPTTNEDISNQQQQLIKDRLQLEACQKWFTGLDGQLQAMLKALNVPDAKGVVPLQMLQIAEALLERFEGAPQDTYFLRAEVASAGGSYRVRRNLFRTLFWSDGLSYSGGVIVSYAFLNSEAAVVKSGTHHYRYPFNRFRDAWWSKTFGNSFEDTKPSGELAIPQASFLVPTNQEIKLKKEKKAAGMPEISSAVLTNQTIKLEKEKKAAGMPEISSEAPTNQGLETENKSKNAK